MLDRDNERFRYYKELKSLTPNILDLLKDFKTKDGKDRMKNENPESGTQTR